MLGLLLLAFWFTLAGRWDLQYLAVGVGVVVLSLYLRNQIVPRSEAVPGRAAQGAIGPGTALQLAPKILAYLVAVLVELVRANLKVAAIVLNPRLPLSPVFFAYSPPVRSPWGRVLLANSVTLTPGTLTVELDEETFLVHALTTEAAESLVGWAAEGRVMRLERVAAEGGDG